jgi:D-glycero-D-manno-heptose 1,7-bisphosphate phosphatase
MTIESFPAAILDQDGVINFDRGYEHLIEDFEFISGALEACRRFHDAGYRLVVVTNQAGI